MGSLVILMAVDGIVTNAVRHVVKLVRGFAVPVVFITDQPGEVMLQLLRELGVRHPFVADDGGTRIYVPKGYFHGLIAEDIVREANWQVLRLHPQDREAGDAVQRLMGLYRLGDDPVLFVGLGENWTHRALLRQVDVPVIVRNEDIDQMPLLRSIPGAYLTSAAGPAGCTEALLGVRAD